MWLCSATLPLITWCKLVSRFKRQAGAGMLHHATMITLHALQQRQRVRYQMLTMAGSDPSE